LVFSVSGEPSQAELMNTDHKERARPMPIQHTLATSTQNWKDASLMALLDNDKSIVLVILQTTEAWELVAHKKICHKLAKRASLYL